MLKSLVFVQGIVIDLESSLVLQVILKQGLTNMVWLAAPVGWRGGGLGWRCWCLGCGVLWSSGYGEREQVSRVWKREVFLPPLQFNYQHTFSEVLFGPFTKKLTSSDNGDVQRVQKECILTEGVSVISPNLRESECNFLKKNVPTLSFPKISCLLHFALLLHFQ